MTEKTVSEEVSNDVGTSNDPFAPENIGVIQFIQLGRVYDVLMAMYAEQNPTGARKLLQQHYNGKLVGPTPYFDGTFVTDLINGQGENPDPSSGGQGDIPND